MNRARVFAAALALALCAPASGWEHYGGDAGGQRYAELGQITPDNVDGLVNVWTFRTGDLDRRDPRVMRRAKLQTTAILVADSLIVCTGFNEVIALDPGTGVQKWRFDPKVAEDRRPANLYNCRGAAFWTDNSAAQDAQCRSRIFTGTNDARLIALDARTGAPCPEFGANGEVRIEPGMELLWPGEFQITSPPVVARGVVIVGSAIADNARVNAPHGTVRAFDARTGTPRWSWDPIPRDPSNPASATWGGGVPTAGHANVWAPMSIDAARGLVFLPTSSPSPDFFGGLRPGDNAHANSVVALEAETGKIAWVFQTVHHDVWDYDVPAQPTLATLNIEGRAVDVVIQGTKQGFLFVLDRESGAPVFPVEERPVPQGGVAGEALSPTQPMPVDLPALVPQTLTPDDAFGLTFWDRGVCRDAIADSRSEGLYTPPSLGGTILYPMTGGGLNWGGIAFDRTKQIVYANTTRAAHRITLFPAEQFQEMKAAHPGQEVVPQSGAPYGVMREVLLSPFGLPCVPPPWGALAALDLRTKRILWEVRLGTTEELAPLGLALPLGTPTLGGPLVTGGGLVFIGAAMDKYLRAFDAATGAELWQGRLPATGFATPMTYEWEGRQYVVIAAGGHGQLGAEPGDSIVAFALPRPGEPGPSLWSRTIDRPGGRFWAILIGGVLILVAAGGLLRIALRWVWRV